MNEPFAPVSVIPSAPPEKKHLPAVIWWLLGILITLLIAGAAFYLVYMKDVLGFRARMDAEALLPHLWVVEGTIDARTVGTYDAKGAYHSHTLTVPGDLVDYATLDGKTEYAFVSDPKTHDSQLLRFAEGHTDTLASGTSTKLWLALSPDGEYLAYGERQPFDTAQHDVSAPTLYNPSAWTVHLRNLRTGSTTDIAQAALPRFFIKNGTTYVLYLRPNEVHIRSLADGSDYMLSDHIDGLWPVEVSRDGNYLAIFNPNSNVLSYQLYTFTFADGVIKTQRLPQSKSALRIITFDKDYVAGVAYDMTSKQSSFVVVDLAHQSKETVLFKDSKMDHARRIILIP